MELDPKLAKKVLDADLANMAKRVNEGKNLTSNQRAYFLQATGQVPLPESGYAKSKVELAAILGVVALFDGRKEGVHVGVEDPALRSVRDILRHRRAGSFTVVSFLGPLLGARAG